MEFEFSERVKQLRSAVWEFMEAEVLPAEPVYKEQIAESGDPHFYPPVMEELKQKARSAGLWNLFMPDPEYGPGLTNLEYAPLCELMGWSSIGPEAFNCSAPDTGNMEVLARYGTSEQQRQWLAPLLEGEIRSCFAMTEPGVASSDATNVESSIRRDGDEYVINGRKWWSSGASSNRCRLAIFMGKTDSTAVRHRQQSMILVPFDTPGITVIRDATVFGYNEVKGHPEVEYNDVRVPVDNILVGEGEGFAIAQGRLGPGRMHHCMRLIGAAERALELMKRRAEERVTFGQPLVDRQMIREWVARSRIELEQARLLVLKASWMIDTVGNKAARQEIGMIKVVAPNVAIGVIDRAIQVFGAAGLTSDTPLAAAFAYARSLRLADGPDEVHLMSIAKQELARPGGPVGSS